MNSVKDFKHIPMKFEIVLPSERMLEFVSIIKNMKPDPLDYAAQATQYTFIALEEATLNDRPFKK